MNTTIIIATYWSYGIWFLGAIAATAILLLVIVQCMAAWTDHFVDKYRDFEQALFVYRALRAFERSGHRRPREAVTTDERNKLMRMSNALVEAANELGMVVTIETRPEPYAPLAMGRHWMTPDVRPARARYQAEAGQTISSSTP